MGAGRVNNGRQSTVTDGGDDAVEITWLADVGHHRLGTTALIDDEAAGVVECRRGATDGDDGQTPGGQ